MYDKLKEKLKESLTSVLPITLIVLVLSLTLVPMEVGTLALFLCGAAVSLHFPLRRLTPRSPRHFPLYTPSLVRVRLWSLSRQSVSVCA